MKPCCANPCGESLFRPALPPFKPFALAGGMSSLRDIAIIAAAAVVAVAWFENRPLPEPAPDAPITAPLVVAETAAPAVAGGTVTVHSRHGQYWVDGDVNGAIVPFLVDTGASQVALRLQDATAAGVRERDLVYSVTVQTANGETRAAPVRLRALQVGPITLRDVDALVVRDGLSVSLLGMSFLGRLQKFEAGRDRMTLTL